MSGTRERIGKNKQTNKNNKVELMGRDRSIFTKTQKEERKKKMGMIIIHIHPEQGLSITDSKIKNLRNICISNRPLC